MPNVMAACRILVVPSVQRRKVWVMPTTRVLKLEHELEQTSNDCALCNVLTKSQ